MVGNFAWPLGPRRVKRPAKKMQKNFRLASISPGLFGVAMGLELSGSTLWIALLVIASESRPLKQLPDVIPGFAGWLRVRPSGL